MRPLLEAALQFKRMTPWDKMCDTDFVGCRDERTGELRVSCVLGAAGEVFGMVSYRGVEGLGLVHAFLTQEGELRREQILNGMNCLKMEFCYKREMCSDEEPLSISLHRVMANGLDSFQSRPERIVVADETLFKALLPACKQLQIGLELVEVLKAVPNALQSITNQMMGN